MSAHSTPTKHQSPLSHLLGWMAAERRDLWILVAYVICTILLSLAAPFAVQALVNTIAAGVFLQPLIVTVGLLLFALLMAGTFKVLQFCLVEILQQRLFARVALQVADHVPRIQEIALVGQYGPELVNRFFDVVNIQKSIAKLMVIWPTAIIQLLVGMGLLAVYNPIFLLFDGALLLFIVVVLILGWGGLRTSLEESRHKYEVASWLQELARCHSSFKLAGLPAYLMTRTDGLVSDHIRARQAHFRVLLRQTWASYLLQAVAHAGLLAVGGWLVINRSLTIGQLVAAELVMVTILAALDNLVTNVSSVYDLLTGFDKVGHILETETEHSPTVMARLPADGPGLAVDCRKVSFGYRPGAQVFVNLSLEITPGSRNVLVGPSGSGKTTLARLIAGLLTPAEGLITLDRLDPRTLATADVRDKVGWVSQEASIFDGTIEENICIGRLREGSLPQLQTALRLAHLDRELEVLPQGIQSALVAEGKNIPFGLRQRILLARALMKQPRLLILDEALAGLDEGAKQRIMQGLYEALPDCTFLVISHDPVLIARAERLIVLENGMVTGHGSPQTLMSLPNSPLVRLFPSVGCIFTGTGGDKA